MIQVFKNCTVTPSHYLYIKDSSELSVLVLTTFIMKLMIAIQQMIQEKM